MKHRLDRDGIARRAAQDFFFRSPSPSASLRAGLSKGHTFIRVGWSICSNLWGRLWFDELTTNVFGISYL